MSVPSFPEYNFMLFNFILCILCGELFCFFGVSSLKASQSNHSTNHMYNPKIKKLKVIGQIDKAETL